MFTDIEASTRLWEERPDEMPELVARHDERFRQVIEANHGYVVKGTGDGYTPRLAARRTRSRQPSSFRRLPRICPTSR